MTLEEAIHIYVRRKQASGLSFESALKKYKCFLRTVGNLPLREISAYHVLQFLNRRQGSASAFRAEHSVLRHFFDYWAARGAVAEFTMPINLPWKRSKFIPYIFTKEEIHKLLRLVPLSKTSRDKIHQSTVRAAFVMLYATGAMACEVTALTRKDVDLLSESLRFPGSRFKPSRRIPIGRDLLRVMRQYLKWRDRVGGQSEFLFARCDGTAINPGTLNSYFRRVRRAAEISGYLQSSRHPCLIDLRATFAVHQINSWIRRKGDLNRLLPALAAYMGNTGVETTERYLKLAPMRFKNALNKLSPGEVGARWRNDPALLTFLTAL